MPSAGLTASASWPGSAIRRWRPARCAVGWTNCAACDANLGWRRLVFLPTAALDASSDKLSALRRDLYHQALSERERYILKGTRWLLLKNPENLDMPSNGSTVSLRGIFGDDLEFRLGEHQFRLFRVMRIVFPR